MAWNNSRVQPFCQASRLSPLAGGTSRLPGHLWEWPTDLALVFQGSEPSYLERVEQLQAVMSSTLEKVGGGATPRWGRGGAQRWESKPGGERPRVGEGLGSRWPGSPQVGC